MSIILLLLKQNIVMLFYLLIGYFLFRKKLVGKQGSGDIGRMLLYIIMPMAIVNSYLSDFSLEKLEGLIVSFIMALLSLLLAVVVSRIFFKKEEGIERFGSAFSNAGFIGIPLVQMPLGTEAVFYVSSFVALLNIFQWTYGVLVMTGNRSSVSVGKIRTNPIVLSFLAGIILFLLPVKLPDAPLQVIETLASMNGPLAMIVLGTYLAQIPLKSVYKERIVYKCTFVRLVVIPFLTMALLLLFPKEYTTIKLAVLIAASAPVGSNVAIFAQLYQQNYTTAVKEVCMSTLFSIATMPAVLGIANYIW